MKKITLLALILFNLYGWELKGVSSDTNISNTNSIIWIYRNNQWFTSVRRANLNHIDMLKAGEGYWINEGSIDSDLSDTNVTIKRGWNLISPTSDELNLTTIPSVLLAWKYNNNQWLIYNKNGENYGYSTFEKVSIGEGVWIYSNNEAVINAKNFTFSNYALTCQNGICNNINITNPSYKIGLVINQYNRDLKFGFDLYRPSNNTHYKLAFGPFQVDENSIKTSSIYNCVEKQGVGGSCKNINRADFLSYHNGYLQIDAKAIANAFDKAIPNTHENFIMKIYTDGFDIDGSKNDSTFDIYGEVTLSNPKSVEFNITVQ
jgi:hypothetical protein